MDTYSMIKMQSSKAKDNSFNLQKLGILASFCSLYIAYKADWGDLFTYFSVENFVAMASFVDEQNEDKCVFGTEVFVTKERRRVKAECLSLIKDPCSVKYVWKIENFSKLNEPYYFSEAFSAGGHKWKILLYPKGLSSLKGSHLSLYLKFVHDTPDSKAYTDCTLRIVDQLQAKHVAFKADHCFTPTNLFLGWQKFVTPSYLNDPNNGCLVKDVCLVEAEVNVWGCQSSTADIVK
ncbi:hypothetical protein Q3G72_001915 [Acer saccharum]|nr:hypothetical protein Q3G72_001915 [Acer saccharum]